MSESPTARFAARVARAGTDHPRATAVGLALAALAAAPFAARLRAADLDLAALQAAHAGLTPPPLVDLLVVPPAGTALPALTEALAAVPGVAEARAIPTPTPALARVSGLDGAPAVRLRVRRDTPDAPVLTAVRAAAPPGTWVAGLPSFDLAHGAAARRALSRTLAAVAAVTVALAAMLTRRFTGVILPLTSIMLSTLLTAGLTGAVGQTLAGPNLLLLPLVIVLGLSDSLYLLREHAARVAARTPDPARETLVEVGHACLLTSLTTMAGFLALGATGSPVLASFGWLAAAGIGLAWFASVLVPAVAWRLGDNPIGFAAPGAPSATEEKWFNPYSRRIAASILATTIAAGVPLAARVRFELPLHGDLPDGDPVAREAARVAEALDGASLLTVTAATADPDDPAVYDALREVGRALRPLEVVGGVLGPGEILAAEGRDDTIRRGPPFARRLAWRRARAAIAEAGVGAGPLTVLVQLRDRPTSELATALTRIEAVQAHHPGVHLSTSGSPAIAVAAWRRLPEDAAAVIGVSLLTLVAGVGWAWRDVRLALAAAAPLAATTVLTLATFATLHVPISPPTLLVFSVTLGVGVDASIHLFSATREALAHGQPLSEAVPYVLATAGRALATATVLLIAGLLTLLTSDISLVRDVGRTLSIAMVGNAVLSVAGFVALAPWAFRSPEAGDDRLG